jgi:hypothetical protein
VRFDDGSEAEIVPTEFLIEARAVMLARYAEARSPELDAVLERAGILSYYADYVGDQAGTPPDPAIPPQPADNRPYPAGP